MARSSTPVLDCPTCTGTLIQIRLGDQLTLRSCSKCDSRWWLRADELTEIGAVLAEVADGDKRKGRAA